MISSEQLKAGRVMLGWSAQELADRAGVGPVTVRRYELMKGVPSGNSKDFAQATNNSGSRRH